MATETFVIESQLAPEVVFDLLIDLSRVPEWDRGIAESRLISGTPGAVGALYDVGLTGFDRQPTRARYEITAVADRSFTMVGTHPQFRAEDTVTVVATAGGCRVRYDAELRLLGDDPPITDAQLDATFAKLVAVVEVGLTSLLEEHRRAALDQ